MKAFYSTHMETNAAVRKIVGVLNGRPNFEKYHMNRTQTRRVAEHWENQAKCGGAITISLTSDSAKEIETPDLVSNVRATKSKILGFFNITRIQESPAYAQAFFDVQLLLVAPPSWTPKQQQAAVSALTTLQNKKGETVCCMEGGGHQVEQYLFGIARIVQYNDAGCCTHVTYAESIWEGEVSGGHSNTTGFARVISINDDRL